MAYVPISRFPFQYFKLDGNPANGYYLKFYQANSASPISMQTDAGGATSIAKCKLNEYGFPISNPNDNSTVFIPHLSTTYTAYRFVLYASAADADANNVTSGLPNVQSVGTMEADATLRADLAASSGSSLVGFLQSGAGAVARTAQAKMREFLSPQDRGAVGDGITDDTTAWNNWISAAGSKYIPAGSYLVSGVVKKYTAGTFVNTVDTNHGSGLYSLEKTTSGNANTTHGYMAGAAITTGGQNTVVGKGALETSQAGTNNTAIGFGAMRYGNNAACIQNTILGAFCGEQITEGHSNTAAGHNTLKTLTTGDLNSAFGQGALAYTTTGNYNAAFGYHSLLYYNGDYGTAVGTESLMNCTTGAGNVGIGRGTLKQVTTQTLNTAVGHLAGTSCSGDNNVFVGESAGWLTTTGSDNTVVGMNALVSNTTGEHNVAIGRGALYSNNSSRNIAVGRYAAISATSDENTAIGHGCLYDCTSGRVNTALGVNALTGLVTYNNCTGIGASAAVTGSNQVQLGDSSTTTYAYGAVQNRSDARDKAEVRNTVLGLSFINALRPVDFKWDLRSEYYTESQVPSGKFTPAGEVIMKTARTPVAGDGSKKRNRYHHGLIAQEVKAVCVSAGVDFGGYQDHSVNGGSDVLSLGYEELIGPLIKAVQQLSAEIEILKSGG